MIREHSFLGATWYWSSHAYADDRLASLAYQKLAKAGKARRGGLELGVYRHGTPVSGMIIVTALGLKRGGVTTANRILSSYGSFDNEPDEETLEALISRRVRVVAELASRDAEKGSYEFLRQVGATLNRDGTMEENV